MCRKTAIAIYLVSALTLIVACSRNESGEGPAAIEYPETATIDHVDNYHGTEIADPFRWLEDDVRESETVKNWVDAQNEVTFAYLATIPERELIAKRLRELWDYERYSLPKKAGGRYFYEYNSGLQNQEVIYTQNDLDGDAELLIDPNTWSDDGTIALAGYYPSKDGSHIAYTIQDGGSDWREAKILNVETGEVQDDQPYQSDRGGAGDGPPDRGRDLPVDPALEPRLRPDHEPAGAALPRCFGTVRPGVDTPGGARRTGEGGRDRLRRGAAVLLVVPRPGVLRAAGARQLGRTGPWLLDRRLAGRTGDRWLEHRALPVSDDPSRLRRTTALGRLRWSLPRPAAGPTAVGLGLRRAGRLRLDRGVGRRNDHPARTGGRGDGRSTAARGRGADPLRSFRRLFLHSRPDCHRYNHELSVVPPLL